MKKTPGAGPFREVCWLEVFSATTIDANWINAASQALQNLKSDPQVKHLAENAIIKPKLAPGEAVNVYLKVKEKWYGIELQAHARFLPRCETTVDGSASSKQHDVFLCPELVIVL